jgi:hypothetical protein
VAPRFLENLWIPAVQTKNVANAHIHCLFDKCYAPNSIVIIEIRTFAVEFHLALC